MQRILLGLVVLLFGISLLIAHAVDNLRGRCAKLEEVEYRWLRTAPTETESVKVFLQYWDGEDWQEVPIVDNEDLEE